MLTNAQGIRAFCPQCLAEVDPTTKNCFVCDKKLTYLLCQRCGSILTIEANYCSKCGIRIKKSQLDNNMSIKG